MISQSFNTFTQKYYKDNVYLMFNVTSTVNTMPTTLKQVGTLATTVWRCCGMLKNEHPPSSLVITHSLTTGYECYQ